MPRTLLLLLASLLAALPGCRCGKTHEAASDEDELVSTDPPPKPEKPRRPYVVPAAIPFGDGVLAVWAKGGREKLRTVWGMRLSTAGEPKEPVAIGQGDWASDVGAAAFRGGAWVVWEQHTETSVQIMGARLDAEGKLVDPKPAKLSTLEGTQRSPKIACLPETCVLTYTVYPKEGPRVSYGARLGTRGPLSIGAPEPMPQTVTTDDTALAAAGDHFLMAVATEDQASSPLSTVVIPKEGALWGEKPLPIAAAVRASDAQLECFSKRCALGWHELRSTGERRGVHTDGMEAHVGLVNVDLLMQWLDLDGKPQAGAGPKRVAGIGSSAMNARMQLLANEEEMLAVSAIGKPPEGLNLEQTAPPSLWTTLWDGKAEARSVPLPNPLAPELPTQIPALVSAGGTTTAFVLLAPEGAKPEVIGVRLMKTAIGASWAEMGKHP